MLLNAIHTPLTVHAMDTMLLRRTSAPKDIYVRLRWHYLESILNAPDWEPGECDG